MAEVHSEFDPRKFLKAAATTARSVCASRFEAFGCAGQAGRIKPLPLDTIAATYTKSELDPVIAGTRQTA